MAALVASLGVFLSWRSTLIGNPTAVCQVIRNSAGRVELFLDLIEQDCAKYTLMSVEMLQPKSVTFVQGPVTRSIDRWSYSSKGPKVRSLSFPPGGTSVWVDLDGPPSTDIRMRVGIALRSRTSLVSRTVITSRVPA